MRYVEIRPPPHLERLVRCLWVLEGGDELLRAPPQRVLPDGRLELVVHLADPFVRMTPDGTRVPARRAIVAGQMTRAVRLIATGRTACVGLRLEPPGARAVVGTPLGALMDAILPLDV